MSTSISMHLGPGDLRNQRFRHALGGFAVAEVESFLEVIADRWEQMLEEMDHLRLESARLAATVREQQRAADMLADAAAQQMADLSTMAEETAQRLTADARSRCDSIAAATDMRLREIDSAIERLRVERHEDEAAIERTMQALHGLLVAIREQNTRGSGSAHTARPAESGTAEAPGVAGLEELDELSETIMRSFGLTREQDGSVEDPSSS